MLPTPLIFANKKEKQHKDYRVFRLVETTGDENNIDVTTVIY